MCRAYEAAIGDVGGLDLVMLGLGPNAHLASNEPGTPFESTTRAVPLPAETVGDILTDEVIHGPVSARAVTLGLATILAAREVVLLVSGRGKREALLPGLTPARHYAISWCLDRASPLWIWLSPAWR